MTVGADRKATPRFVTLQKEVFRSFVSPATWLPSTFSYWTGLEGDRKLVVSRRSGYLAHPHLELARVLSDTKDDDLVLVSSYSTSMVTTGITVTKEDWVTHSAFVVTCIEPDVLDQKCCYSRWTGLDCQVIWGNKVSYRKTAPFSSYKTSINESVAEKGTHSLLERERDYNAFASQQV